MTKTSQLAMELYSLHQAEQKGTAMSVLLKGPILHILFCA